MQQGLPVGLVKCFFMQKYVLPNKYKERAQQIVGMFLFLLIRILLKFWEGYILIVQISIWWFLKSLNDLADFSPSSSPASQLMLSWLQTSRSTKADSSKGCLLVFWRPNVSKATSLVWGSKWSNRGRLYHFPPMSGCQHFEQITFSFWSGASSSHRTYES